MTAVLDRDAYARSGVLLTNLSGILLFLGTSAVLGWEPPKWPWFVGVAGFIAVAVTWIGATFLLVGESVTVRVVLGFAFCLLTILELAAIGYSIHGLPVLAWAPAWPGWIGVVLICAAAPCLLGGIGALITDIEVQRRFEQELAERRKRPPVA